MSIKRRVDKLEERARPQWEKDARQDVADGLITWQEFYETFPELDPHATAEQLEQIRQQRAENERIREQIWAETSDAEKARIGTEQPEWAWWFSQLVKHGHLERAELREIYGGRVNELFPDVFPERGA